jgi:hypothetical protein
LIQSSKKSIIIQTNHAVIIDICKQRSIISTNSVMRMNLRLVRTSQFLSQFSNLKIRHKFEKYHLISNALSRLQNLNKENLSNDHAELNELFVEYVIYVYNTILVKLNSEFRARIIEKYFKDETWRKIIRTIDENAALKKNAAKLFFVQESIIMLRESNSYMTSNIDSRSSKSVSSFNEIQKNSTSSKSFSRFNESQNNQHDKNFIYHVNKSTKEKRLCISSNCVANILIIAHEHERKHSKFEITFEIISRSWYIRDLIKALRAYIRNCSQCLQIQIRRHCEFILTRGTRRRSQWTMSVLELDDESRIELIAS